MPALSAKQHDPHAKAFFSTLWTTAKKPFSSMGCYAKIAACRHGLPKYDKPFDYTRSYVILA